MRPSVQPGKVCSSRTLPLMPPINALSRRLARTSTLTTWHGNPLRLPNPLLRQPIQFHTAVDSRVQTGLATVPELLQAKQQLAQARFDLEKARGSERDAFVDLM